MATTENCSGCAETIPKDARFCPHCGQRQGASPVSAPVESGSDEYLEEFDDRDAQKLAKDLYEAHANLLSDYRGRSQALGRRLDDLEKQISAFASSAPSPQIAADCQVALEEIDEIGEAWTDIQHSYNADSELLDEDFLDRQSEMELDVELPDDLREKIVGEHEGMSGDLEAVAEKLALLSDRGASVIDRSHGRWRSQDGVAASKGRRGLWWPLVAGLAAAGLGLAYELDAIRAASLAAPGFILFCINGLSRK